MDDLFKKTDKDWDCRALGNRFLDRFKEGGGDLFPFIILVKNDKDLELALRGNGHSPISNPASGGEVIIYRENHAMFTIHPQTITINPNYLRFCEDWKEKLDELVGYGFNNGQIIHLGEVKRTEKKGSVAFSCSFEKSKISIPISKVLEKTKEEGIVLDKLYTTMSKIFNDFLDNKEHQTDQFLVWANKNDKKYAGEISKFREKKQELEKTRQQQLYSFMRFQKDGYFFYDMEYEQRHESQTDRKEDKKKGLNNKPDMQAIRFNEEGKPEAWVFVEVKSTSSAYGGTSGLQIHIDKMKKYIANKENLERRRREAYMMLKQFEEMGLLKLERPIDIEEFNRIIPEILIVLTDKAITCWDNDNDIDKSKYTTLSFPQKLNDGTRTVLIKI